MNGRTDERTNAPRTGMSCAIESADLHLPLRAERNADVPRSSRKEPRFFILKQIDRYVRMTALYRASTDRRLMRPIRSQIGTFSSGATDAAIIINAQVVRCPYDEKATR